MTPVILQIKTDSKGAAADFKALGKDINQVLAAVKEQVAAVSASLKELTFSPGGILRGADQAERALHSVALAGKEAGRELEAVTKTGSQSGEALRGMGGQAGSAASQLAKVRTAGGTVAVVLGDVANAADTADVALDALDDGAAMAQKSVGGLARAAGGALTKLDALSGAAFDPSGVVAGADVATAALDRVKVAAAEAKGMVRGAGAGSPIFLGGGHGRGGNRIAEEGEGPMGFRGGLKAGTGAAGDLAGGAAMAATILAAVSGKLSMTFDNLLQGIRGNTTMTDADAAGMRSQTLALMKTGTPEEQLAQGYKHIANFGYHGQQAAQIAAYGNRFGIGTHTDVEQTDDMLAGMMNANRHADASQVSRYANTAHFAAAGSNMDVRDLEKNSTRTVGLAANYMGPSGLPDALAAYAALVQHRMSPSRADTQVSGMLGQIAAPTPKAQKEADKLGLTNFNAQGLKTDGLFEIISAVRSKIASLPVNDQAASLKNLFNNKQGGTGASFLTGAANASYNTLYNDPKSGTKAAFAGKIDAIDPAYNAQMKQTQQAFAALAGEIKSDFIPIGERVGPLFLAAIPIVRTVAGVLKTLMDGFTRLPKPIQEAVISLGGLLLIGKFLPILGGFSLLSEKTSVVLGGLAKALLGGGEAAEVSAAGIAGMALPLVAAAAAVALFALAWKSDFGHIREVTAKVSAEVVGFINSQFGQVKAWFTKNMPEIRETVQTVLTFIGQFWKSHGAQVMGIVGPLWNFIKDTVVNALHLIENVVKLAMDIINGHWSAAGRDLLAIVGNLWNELDSLFENGGRLIDNTLMLVIDVVLDFGKRLFEGMLNAGQQAINGIIGGIKGGIGKVAGAASDLGHSITGAVTNVLDIHSPSRVMQKLGLNTAEGLAQGIRDGKVSVDAASRMLATSPAAIVREAISQARRGQSAGRKRAGQVESAEGYAATVAETPEEKELHKLGELRAKGLISAQAYSEAYRQIKAGGNQASEKEAARHVEALRQIEDGLKAYAKTPETPSLDRQEAAAHAQYRRQIKDLGGDRYGPHSPAQQQGMTDAGTLLQDKLGGIQTQRAAIKQKAADKAAAEAQAAQEAADAQVKQSLEAQIQLQRELWQHAGGDMTAYFQSLRTEADAALKDVQDHFGPASPHPNAPAVTAAQSEHDTRLLEIAQQQTDAANQLADQRTQHDLEQGKISQAQYVQYLTQRRDAYAQYSQEWLTLDSQLYAADTELQRKQLQSVEDLFAAHKISLEQYKKLLSELAVPASSPVYQDVQGALNGAQNKSNRQMVGGDDFWGGLADSASQNGSRVLDALFHPKDKKKIFKSMWEDLLGSAEDGLKGGLSAILKNLITGQGTGGGLGGLFGGLFGHGRNAPSSGASAASPTSPTFGGIQGINGPVGGGAGGGGLGSLLGAASSFIPGAGAFGALASMLPSGVLTKLFSGGLFGGIFKKLFHFAGGGIVPGHGNHDSVPAMLMPGEMVLPKTISKMLQQAAAPVANTNFRAGVSTQSTTTPSTGTASGSSQVEINHYGDKVYHYEADTQAEHKKLAKSLEDLLRSGIPA